MKLKVALAFAWACIQVSGWAQSTVTEPDGQAWRRANAAVGQHQRGHADILAQEAAQTQVASQATGTAGPVLSLRQATTMALRQRPDLWLGPALNTLEIARINAQVAQLSHQVSRAWVEAVAANQSVVYLQDALEAAEAGAELAQRMAAVGNWSQMQRIQTRLLQSDAAMALAVARQQALSTRERLVRLLGLWGEAAKFSLPPRLPDLPASPVTAQGLEEAALRQHLPSAMARAHAERQRAAVSHDSLAAWQSLAAGITPTWQNQPPDDSAALATLLTQAPVLDTRQNALRHALDEAIASQMQADTLTSSTRSRAREAYGRYRSAYDLARHQRDDVVLWRTKLQEETQTRYNGMLLSTWDLLASAGARIRSVNAALLAQRDFWLAHTDLQGVLAGLDIDFSAEASGPAQGASAQPAH